VSAVPAPHPCASCPYRRDVPSGVWVPDEYLKLPPYDEDTPYQPPSAFFCHQQNGRLCSGWVGCHDMTSSLGLRMAASVGALTADEVDAALDYECAVPLFESGAEAAAHGLRDVPDPSPEAQRVIAKVEARRARRKRT
jgi:hypothetical protein